MRKLKFQLDRKSLETIYIVFIRPLLEYGDVIWDNCTQYEKRELDKIQNEAARIVTGATKLVSLDTLYSEIRWETLEQRRKNHRLTLFYKMRYSLTPQYLSSLVPESISNVFNYNLRHSSNLRGINARTTQYQQSFLPTAIKEWNNLPLELQQSNTVNSFKYNLTKDKEQTPKHYYTGSRRLQILHTRLRTHCSALNLDLFLKNVSETPLCSCGSIEDSQHYVFHCSHYQTQRTALMNAISTIQTPTLNLLLYGSSNLSVDINKAIFDKVHKFILDTKRF